MRVATGSYSGGTLSFNATNNWWGAASGPNYNGSGPGTGDNITDPDGVVAYSPFLTSNATTPCASLPNIVYVDDSWAAIPNGQDPDGAGPATAMGYDAFATIQGGVDGVATGGTVIVYDGNYPQASTISLNKSLSLQGPNAAISPNGGSRVPEAVITGAVSPILRISLPATVVTIQGFKFDNTGVVDCYETGQTIAIRRNIYSNGTSGGAFYFLNGPASLTIDDNYLTNAVLADNDAIFVAGDWNGTTGTTVSITNNVIENSPADSGLNLSSVSGTISGNRFSSLRYYAILLANNSSNMTISGNVFDGMTNPDPTNVPTWGAGVRTYAPAFTGPVNITSNLFKNCFAGVGFRGVPADPSANIGSNVHVNFNSFVNNVHGVSDGSAGALDAENNWWGCNYGPGLGGAGCSGTANDIFNNGSGTVDANPWIVLGASASPNTINAGGTSTVSTDMTRNSDNVVPSGTLPNMPVAYSATNGTMTPPTSTVVAGMASSMFTSTNNNSAIVSTTVDNQTVNTPITVISANANLSNLTLSAATLNEPFDPNTTSYTANVPYSTTSTTETPTAQDANATITVNGTPVASGTPSSSIPLAVGPNTITTVVTAQDGVTMKTYTVTVTRAANTPPTITAAAGVTRQQGSPLSNSTIATVNDTESGAGAVVVTVTSSNPSNGVTISNIVNTGGTVTADVVASCSATNASFTLQASDGNLTATDTLNVTVTANPAPTLSYNNASVNLNGSTVVNPATGPSDNGTVSTIVLLSQGTYTGTISVNNLTGDVSISNAAPVGSHTITIRATDNCGLTTDATFTLTVNCVTPSTVYVNDDWTGTLPGADPDGAGPATSFGCDSFATIQDGVNGVTDPGTVIVYAGTYPEAVTVNKSLIIRGAQAGQNANTRFAAFVSGPNGPKANPAVESILTAAANAPNSGANDTLHIMANNVTFDGFVVDGNNPALAQGGAVLVGGINADARTGIQTEDAAGNNFSANNVLIQNNIVQNFAGDNTNNLGGGVTLINPTNVSPATSGSVITRNVVRNFGAYGILLSFNAYGDVTFNTVDMPDYPTANAGIWVYDFINTGTPHTTNITNNDVTVGQDNFGGIWINLAYLAAININTNTVHAAASVVSGSDFNYGIYLTSLRPGTTASLSGNIVGASGGQFDRGIALWNVGTSPTTTTVKNGSVKNSVDGISLIYNDANFGPAGASSAANVSGMTVSGSQVGVVVDATSSGANTVTMMVTNSTLSGNTAANGGGIT